VQLQFAVATGNGVAGHSTEGIQAAAVNTGIFKKIFELNNLLY